jgi:hypothetical protein
MTDPRTTFDFFQVPDFESLIPENKLIKLSEDSVSEYNDPIFDINVEDSMTIIDSIYESDCKKLLSVISKINFSCIKRYTISNFDNSISYLKYKKYRYNHEKKFISAFIKFGNFEIFKCLIDHILTNYSLELVILILDYEFLDELRVRFIESSTSYYMFSDYDYDTKRSQKSKIYFEYFSSIGLNHSIDYINNLYKLLSNRRLMFADLETRETFWYMIKQIEPFKLFFSNIPLYELPNDIEYIKKAYSYGLNVHSDYLDTTNPNSSWNTFYHYGIPSANIMQFLYLAGRDAMKDLLTFGLDSGVLLSSLKPEEPSNFNEFLNFIKLKKLSDESKRIPYMDNYQGIKFVLNYSDPNIIESINVVLDFARNNSNFPKELQLTEHYLFKKYNLHSESMKYEIQTALSGKLNDSIIDIIMSYY